MNPDNLAYQFKSDFEVALFENVFIRSNMVPS